MEESRKGGRVEGRKGEREGCIDGYKVYTALAGILVFGHRCSSFRPTEALISMVHLAWASMLAV